MSRRPPRSPLPTRRLRRESDGSLYDVDERRRIELPELADDVRSGRYFRVVRHTGEDCTQEVLAQVLTNALPGARTGGAGLGSLVTNLMGAIVNGAAAVREVNTGRADRGPNVPKNRTARSTGRHEWWEGD